MEINGYVMGWSLDSTMKAKLVNQALLKALCQRRPKKSLIWYSDRGSQDASKSQREVIKSLGLIQSLSHGGYCWDNAVLERFFHSLKVELVNQKKDQTREPVMQSIFEYIEVFYNRKRLHSTNDYWSLVDYEGRPKVA